MTRRFVIELLKSYRDAHAHPQCQPACPHARGHWDRLIAEIESVYDAYEGCEEQLQAQLETEIR